MNDEFPMISVIIPCYNCEKYISLALDSLFNQTYKNFEVICVNDGSIDKTEDVIKNWTSNHNLSVSVISQSNGGVSCARNRGISSSNGEYICFLDADDLYHPVYLERLIQSMRKTKADVAYCRLSRKHNEVFSFKTKKEYWLQTQEEAMQNLLYRMWDYGFYCYIYKKDIIEKKKLSFDIDSKYGEDREFIWKYISHCHSVAWIDQPLYYYRESPGSATRKKVSWRRTDSIKAVQRTELYLKQMNCVFYKQYHKYMNARVMWAIAKAFAVSGEKMYFMKLANEYDVLKMMRVTAKDSVRLVRIASKLYLINPLLFYYTIYFYGML